MSGDLSSMTESELVAAVRSGAHGANAELFRRHWAPTVRVANGLVGPDDAEDLASDAFAKIFDLLSRGKGPEVAFRPYLMAMLRTMRVDRIRRGTEILVADFTADQAEPIAADGAESRAEADLVAQAFRSLPERWQLALWHTEVEGEPLSQVAGRLGIKANAVAALCFRAREGLRLAYLAEHLATTQELACRATLDRLPRLTRGDLTLAHQTEVEAHLAHCASCSAASHELRLLNTQLGAALLPAIAGTAALVAYPDLSGPGLSHQRGSRWSRTTLAVAALAGAAITAGIALWPADEPVPEAPVSELPPVATAPSPKVSPSPPSAAPSTSAPAGEGPAPSATPSPEPPLPAIGFGPVRTEVLSRGEAPWAHVALPLAGSDGAVEMVVELQNVAEHTLHADDAFGAWSCRAATPARLVCRLPASHIRTLGLDLAPAEDAPMAVTATVSLLDVPAQQESERRRILVRIPRIR